MTGLPLVPSWQPALPVVKDDMPILAHRAARVVMLPGGWVRFRPMYASLRFAQPWLTELRAECYGREMGSGLPARHDCPYGGADYNSHGGCRCGIYAVPADVEADHMAARASVDLLVELYGRIVVHEKGYRAAFQRVLECRLLSCRAHRTGEGPCPNRVETFGWGKRTTYGTHRFVSARCRSCDHPSAEFVWDRAKFARSLAPIPVSDLTS